ncbi:MAG TPA: hypothetical protein DHV36_09710 [Desulfobacteraceae bacterium]|nr:hypothetical protein [Desulfobacteraceae bacterium]
MWLIALGSVLKERWVPLALIIGLPLSGVAASGMDIRPYLAFPPKTVRVSHAPFSFIAFFLITGIVLVTVVPMVRTALSHNSAEKDKTKRYPMPWWGKLSFPGLALFWCLAWTRMEWMAQLQPHTFFPLWLSLILSINALTVRRSGTCPLTAAPGRFLLLFPVSAAFWWLFEYLNRFVANWFYTGSQYPALTYFLLATLSFSTVLPGVESMKAFLTTFERINKGFRTMPPLPQLSGRTAGSLLMAAGGISLALIGIFPDQLFFTLWLAPFFLLLGHALYKGLSHPFTPVFSGDYTRVAAYALAALCCGFFWELFNMYSLARWEYSVPYVQVFHIFEMPVLGYAGYLPFGLECALIIHMVYNTTLINPNNT